MLRYGVVENRQDPLKLGRCQVRVMGLHTADKTVLPTEELPWALMMQPATSAAISGIGQSPVGVVPGTWVIVMFADGDDCQQPIIMGTLGGIPDVNTITSAMDDDIIVIKDSPAGQPHEQIVTSDVQGNLNKSTSNPIAQPQQPQKMIGGGGIDKTIPPTSPPRGSVENTMLASQGINEIILACKSNGFEDRNAISAILGIVGGECKWIPKTENLNYSAARLADVYTPFMKNPALAKEYENNPEKLAEFIYGGNSKGLGNDQPGDGWKYRGRGFIQITGKYNYTRYGKLAGVDIVANPDLLNSDLTISAKVAVVYFKDRLKNCKVPHNDPKFFDAAAKAVNRDPVDIYNRKQKYYEYFAGKELASSSNVKSASPEDVYQRDTLVNDSGRTTLPGGDRSSNTILGFSDPNGKYPLRTYLHEPDTNRLARGKIDGTCVESKDDSRITDIPTAFGNSWDQPVPPFASTYPYNKVFESESGHVMEFDDTPGNERTNMFHRSGTFTETDVNGSQVNKIVGDGYYILERNGCIYIAGECNLTVDGNVNILANSNVNLEVMGDANVDIRRDANIGVARNVDLGVGGNVRAKVVGNMSTNVGGNMSSKVVGNASLDISGNMSTNVAGNFDLKCTDFNVSASSASIKTSGISAIDASSVYWNSGKSKSATVTSLSDIATHIPANGETINSNMRYLESPPRNIVDDFSLGESPEDFDSNTINILNNEIVGEKSTPSNTPAGESEVTYANNIKGLPPACDIIMNTENFQASYVLSKTSNITIGTFLECIGNCSFPTDATVCDVKGGPMYRISKQEVVCNMKQVAENILEKVYEVAGGKDRIIISSSFRTDGVSIHSNPSSDHNKGRAIDLQLRGASYDYQGHYDLVKKLYQVLPYDQLILEYRDPKPGQPGKRKVWIHISYRGEKNRKMAFTMLNDSTYSRDSNGQPNGYFLL